MSPEGRVQASVFAGGDFASVVVVRVGWVLLARLAPGALHRSGRRWAPKPMPWPVSTAMGWAGIRGVATLAAAFSLPDVTPGRGLVTLSAYAVVSGTLVLQAATLDPLIRRLGIGDDRATEHEVAELRRELVRRVLAAIEGREDDAATSMRIRLLEIAAVTAQAAEPQGASSLDWLGLDGVDIQREGLEAMRVRNEVNEAGYRRVLEEPDWAEINFRESKDDVSNAWSIRLTTPPMPITGASTSGTMPSDMTCPLCGPAGTILTSPAPPISP